ncbi:hypothetical protein A4A49_00859 [Nicotiana attenuata]|uniref:Uncharacterized protein n=1 Tax=Nicotiana attenuata TaxID=49451 RepID=A0A1J6HTX9_NICAT|nr:hypothetical protein A4A49_00859 [Nicotiana attenuata]
MVRWKKSEVKQSILQQGLHLAVLGKFSYGKPVIQELRKAIPNVSLKGRVHDEGKDQGKESEVLVSTDAIGTTANSTKVLASGKVVAKPNTNHAKQEWMQARKNKYQRDKRGYIIEENQGKEVNKGKGKAKFEEIATKTKFNALEVEEVQNPILQITEGKGEDHNNGRKGVQTESQHKKVQEKLTDGKGEKLNLNPNASGNGTIENELKRVKKEAVENVLENSPNPNESLKGGHELVRSTAPMEERVNKESTIVWVHRRFGANKEELRQLNVPTNHSCQDISSQTYGDSGQGEEGNEVNSVKLLWNAEVEAMDDQKGAMKAMEDKEKRDSSQVKKTGKTVDSTVNPSGTQTRVDCNLSSMNSNLEKPIGGDRGALKEAGNQDGSGQGSLSKKKGNGTVNPSKTVEILAFVDGVPVYCLEKGLDDNVPTEVRKEKVCQEQQTDHGNVPDPNGAVKTGCCATVTPDLALPVAYASGIGSPMQIHIIEPLRSPNQVFHDIITHKELTDDIQHNLIVQQRQFEVEEEDESAAENCKAVAKEGGLSATSAARIGRKGKKNQSKETQAPTRILPKRAASTATR